MIRVFLLTIALSTFNQFVEPTPTYSNLNIEISPYPTLKKDYTLPQLDAKAALVMDINSGKILYSKNKNEKLPIASLTKIMTALIILEENSLDESVHIQTNFKDIEGSQMYLYYNETITVKNLLLGLLISSANDAAKVLAIYNAGSVDEFVKKMNKRALDLGLFNTKFANPIGYDDPNQYSTVWDLSILSLFALKNDFFSKVVQIKSRTVYSTDRSISHNLKNTNKLLNSYLDIRGVKTGTTDLAGQCFIALLMHENKREILSVVLNSPSRFEETKRLLDNIVNNYEWQS